MRFIAGSQGQVFEFFVDGVSYERDDFFSVMFVFFAFVQFLNNPDPELYHMDLMECYQKTFERGHSLVKVVIIRLE